MSIIKAILKTIPSLFKPYILGIIIVTILINIVIFSSLVGAAGYLVHSTTLFETVWLEAIVDWLGSGAATLLAWFLFPLFIPVIISFFCDMISTRIEKDSYPDRLPQQPIGLKEILKKDARFILKLIVVNLLFLPLFLIPVLNILVYYIVNGYLLGREYFEMVTIRHLPVAKIATIRKKNRSTLIMGGVAILLLSTLPLINMIAPVVAVILMTHLFHSTPPEVN